MNHISVGKTGENMAADYLKKAGYSILERNYRTRMGEIDIIASKSGYLIFVEVKTRRNVEYGMPSEAVNYHKQNKIIQSALCYLNMTRQVNSPCRFDILEIMLSTNNGMQYNHIVNAFGN